VLSFIEVVLPSLRQSDLRCGITELTARDLKDLRVTRVGRQRKLLAASHFCAVDLYAMVCRRPVSEMTCARL
jgi:hypothetical protein